MRYKWEKSDTYQHFKNESSMYFRRFYAKISQPKKTEFSAHRQFILKLKKSIKVDLTQKRHFCNLLVTFRFQIQFWIHKNCWKNVLFWITYLQKFQKNIIILILTKPPLISKILKIICRSRSRMFNRDEYFINIIQKDSKSRKNKTIHILIHDILENGTILG